MSGNSWIFVVIFLWAPYLLMMFWIIFGTDYVEERRDSESIDEAGTRSDSASPPPSGVAEEGQASERRSGEASTASNTSEEA